MPTIPDAARTSLARVGWHVERTQARSLDEAMKLGSAFISKDWCAVVFTLYKRWHLIGLEVGVSVASVALRGEPTGFATAWSADVVATAKRDLKPGEMLDGESGYTVWGKLLPATKSAAMGGLPLGLMQKLTRTKSGARWRICSRHRRCKCKAIRGDPTSRRERAPPIQHLSGSAVQWGLRAYNCNSRQATIIAFSPCATRDRRKS